MPSSIAAVSRIIAIDPHSMMRSVSGSSFFAPCTGSPNSAALSIRSPMRPVARSLTCRTEWTRITWSNMLYTSGSRARLRNGARPVPVEKKNNRLPPISASVTSVPVGFFPIYTSSPASISCSFDVSGPSSTLIDRNSNSSA
ncbi:hypothetical protein WR25_14911 [Diploscapter pachys]|uniref:Uncharacterized protein n=1 Tax=Diploscapter pachys TaxID=2018661 RepID=A0A2A2M4E9_9BILA|nr:hypothetical protein WR25_14911 [Diploscapter pachys]